jgi:hypothetical protein
MVTAGASQPADSGGTGQAPPYEPPALVAYGTIEEWTRDNPPIFISIVL